MNFSMEPEKVIRLKFEGIKNNFRWHFENNPFYREYCKLYPKLANTGKPITPDDIKTYEDLNKIPLLMSDWFKELSIRNLVDNIVTRGVKIATHFTTSGTTGNPTRYPYDGESIENINRVSTETMIEIGKIEKGDIVIFLTPRESSTGLVRGGYMMFKRILGEENILFLYEKEITQNPKEKLKSMLKNISGEGKIHLYGPPFVYYEIAKKLEEEGECLNLTGKIFTAGGWKRYAGGEITRDKFDEIISRTFGVDKMNIRDGFGLTDIMTILLECEYHHKHVPLSVYVSIRDPENFIERVSTREEGLVAFLSPHIKSYPPFVITGDIAIESFGERENCECGRIGNTIEYRRRAKGTSSRGCSLVLEELLNRIKRK